MDSCCASRDDSPISDSGADVDGWIADLGYQEVGRYLRKNYSPLVSDLLQHTARLSQDESDQATGQQRLRGATAQQVLQKED